MQVHKLRTILALGRWIEPVELPQKYPYFSVGCMSVHGHTIFVIGEVINSNWEVAVHLVMANIGWYTI